MGNPNMRMVPGLSNVGALHWMVSLASGLGGSPSPNPSC